MQDGQFQYLSSANYRRMPWKNGGGETVEIIVSPEGAGLANFDWRISMATVASDGPFSVFPQIDRTLSILGGAGMTLFIEGRDPILLTRNSAPLPFPADAPTSATLVDGPITDLNVMSRRGKLSHTVERMTVNGTAYLALSSDTTLLLVDNGDIRVDADGMTNTLSARDCLVAQKGSISSVGLSGEGSVFVIRIREI
jgi:environmental stress-induced protein Ves